MLLLTNDESNALLQEHRAHLVSLAQDLAIGQYEDGSRPSKDEMLRHLVHENDQGEVCLDYGDLISILDDALERTTDGPHLFCVTADQLKSKQTVWFLPNLIPTASFGLLEGEGGLGKSTVALDLIARSSLGATMPDGSPGMGKCRSLFFATEDNTSTLKMRLQAAGADLGQIIFVPHIEDGGERLSFTLPTHAKALEDEIVRTGVKLVYIDSLFDTFASGLDTNKARDVRAALSPLREIAHRTGAVIITTRHVGKAMGRAATRGLGSVDIANQARFVLAVAAHPEEPEKRLLSVAKKNLGRPTDSLAFEIEGVDVKLDDGKIENVGRVRWLGTDVTTADEAAFGVASKRDSAKAALLEALSKGPVKAEELASRIGCSRDTLYRAREDLKAAGHAIRARKTGMNAGWVWFMAHDGQIDAFGEGEE